jgi:hypothetical protein
LQAVLTCLESKQWILEGRRKGSETEAKWLVSFSASQFLFNFGVFWPTIDSRELVDF